MTIKLYNLFIANWFGIKGRASRKEYICRFLMMWFLGYIDIVCVDKIDEYIDFLKPNLIAVLAISFFVLLTSIFILSVIQVFFVTHRRLHDLNTSGWWQLITFVPCGQLLMIGLIFFKGTPTTNKYGDPPTD